MRAALKSQTPKASQNTLKTGSSPSPGENQSRERRMSLTAEEIEAKSATADADFRSRLPTLAANLRPRFVASQTGAVDQESNTTSDEAKTRFDQAVKKRADEIKRKSIAKALIARHRDRFDTRRV